MRCENIIVKLTINVLDPCLIMLNTNQTRIQSWFLVLGSWFLVLGSWFLVLGSWFLVPGLILAAK
jgi:hypothetical protein